MSPRFRRAASHLAARLSASRFAKPASRVALVAAGLACLAAIGNAAVGSAGTPAPSPAVVVSASNAVGQSRPAVSSPPSVAPPAPTALASEAPMAARGPATPEDPVVLNGAAVDDLRRLPGIGEKRANAILALRGRLGRLRAVEDLLKVKGIGRAMLKRLRPLVRLDPKPQPDAGVTEVAR